MNVLNSLLSPIAIAFIVIIVGYLIGQIKLCNVSLDLSGILIVAVFAGWIIERIGSLSTVNIETYQVSCNFFSTLGTALFQPILRRLIWNNFRPVHCIGLFNVYYENEYGGVD